MHVRELGHTNEHGAVLLTVAVTLTALLGMAMIVIDVANWWVHKRHLQGQVDAAALAGAQLFRFPCIPGAIAEEVQRYAGTTVRMPNTTTTRTFNSQLSLGPKESVLGLLNSPNFPDNQGPGKPQTNTGDPCADRAVDVKLTDKDVPYLFVGGALPHINVHARAGVFQARGVEGLLPFAITDPTPETVAGRLVDGDGIRLPGAVDIPMEQTAPGSDPGEFASATVSRPVPAGDPNAEDIDGASQGDYSQPAVNVRIGASSSSPPISEDCSQTGEVCYPRDSDAGLIQSRAWPQHAPTKNDVAVIRAVRLSGAGGDCGSDGYFLRIAASVSGCTVNVTITADFQGGVTPPAVGATPTVTDKAAICLASTTTFRAPSQAGVGCGTDASSLRRSTDEDGHLTWTGQVTVPNERTTTGPLYLWTWAVARAGEVTIGKKKEECTTGPQNKCVQTPIPAQTIFSGNSASSGYIDAVSANGTDPYNRTQCNIAPCSWSVQLKTHFQQLKPAADRNDPLFSLRLSDPQNNQSIECGVPSGTRDMIRDGCQAQFRQWESGEDPECSEIGDYSEMDEPYPCAEKGPGVDAGPFGKGMQDRIPQSATICPAAYRNHWRQYPWSSDPTVPLNDHRLVPVFITRFGSFDNAPPGARNFVRVTGFGLFYITGWEGEGVNDNPCRSGVPGPGADLDDDAGGSGTIVGHFVNVLDPRFTPTPGDRPCDFSTLSLCVPVLTD